MSSVGSWKKSQEKRVGEESHVHPVTPTQPLSFLSSLSPRGVRIRVGAVGKSLPLYLLVVKTEGKHFLRVFHVSRVTVLKTLCTSVHDFMCKCSLHPPRLYRKAFWLSLFYKWCSGAQRDPVTCLIYLANSRQNKDIDSSVPDTETCTPSTYNSYHSLFRASHLWGLGGGIFTGKAWITHPSPQREGKNGLGPHLQG